MKLRDEIMSQLRPGEFRDRMLRLAGDHDAEPALETVIAVAGEPDADGKVPTLDALEELVRRNEGLRLDGNRVLAHIGRATLLSDPTEQAPLWIEHVTNDELDELHELAFEPDNRDGSPVAMAIRLIRRLRSEQAESQAESQQRREAEAASREPSSDCCERSLRSWVDELRRVARTYDHERGPHRTTAGHALRSFAHYIVRSIEGSLGVEDDDG